MLTYLTVSARATAETDPLRNLSRRGRSRPAVRGAGGGMKRLLRVKCLAKSTGGAHHRVDMVRGAVV